MTEKTNSQPQQEKSWHGVDRKELNWYPTINEDACTGCGLCILTCGNSVFKWDTDNKKPVVAAPQNCVLGCTTCAKVCPESAISFSENPATFIRNVIIKYKIYPKVKQELSERLAKFPDHIVKFPDHIVKITMANELTVWHGMNRSEIDWHPVIDPNKCTGCGLCVVTCSEKRNVFGYDVGKRKAVVLNPGNCMVGCNNCQVACLWDAISFSNDVQNIKELAKNLSKETLDKELANKLAKNPELVL